MTTVPPDEALPHPEPNPPPEELRHQTFIVRETLAVLFVGFWLLLFAGELLTGRYAVPFWFHAVAVGVLGYALGLNVAELTAYRPRLEAPAPGQGGVSRFVTLPCPRGDGGEVRTFLEPGPGDPTGRTGWMVWVWHEPGPRGGATRLPHCSAGHRLRGRELLGVLQRAVNVYEAYLEEGGGLIQAHPVVAPGAG